MWVEVEAGNKAIITKPPTGDGLSGFGVPYVDDQVVIDGCLEHPRAIDDKNFLTITGCVRACNQSIMGSLTLLLSYVNRLKSESFLCFSYPQGLRLSIQKIPTNLDLG